MESRTQKRRTGLVLFPQERNLVGLGVAGRGMGLSLFQRVIELELAVLDQRQRSLP